MPSPAAYQEMANLFQVNLRRDASNCFEWIPMFFEMCELDAIVTKKKEVEMRSKIRYDKIHKQRVTKQREIITYKKCVIKGEGQLQNLYVQPSKRVLFIHKTWGES